MKYFNFEKSEKVALECWQNSQFELSDIVLSLTDRKIVYGVKIYAVFSRKEVLNLMRYFVCDFTSMKRDLGVLGDYIERSGDVFSKDFNPCRNPACVTLDLKTMERRARKVYENIMLDLKTIVKAFCN